MAGLFDDASGAPSPFQRVLSPDQGGGLSSAMGLLGRAMGVPTASERAAENDAAIMQKLSGLLETTGSPQKAIVQFLNTPDGHTLMSRPGAVETLTNWTKAITPPNPTAVNTPAGSTSTLFQNGAPAGSISQPATETQNYGAGVPNYQTTPPGHVTTPFTKGANGPQAQAGVSVPPSETQNYGAGTPQYVPTGPGGKVTGMAKGPDGKPTAVGSTSQPTTELQNFDGMVKKFSNLSPQVLDNFVQATLMSTDPQQKAFAISQLVNSKAVTPEEANKFSAGVYQIQQATNEVGEPIGQYFLVDRMSGKTRMLTPGGFTPNATQTTPGPQTSILPSTVPNAQPHVIPPNARNADGSIDGNKLTDKKYMGLGVGGLSASLSLAGQVVRQVNPGNAEESSQVASLRRQQISNIDTALAHVGAAQGGRLKIQSEAWLKQGPSEWTDPIDAYRKMILLHDNVSAMIAKEQANYKDVMLPKQLRVQSQETIQNLQNVIDALPARPDMEQMIKDLKLGTAGAVTVPTAARAVGGMISDAVSTGAKAVDTLRKGTPEPQQQPNTDAVLKMNPAQLQQYGASLPPGPSAARSAYEGRLKQLIQEKQNPGTGKRSEASSRMRLAGDVVPLPINPGPAAGRQDPNLDALRNPPGGNVLQMPFSQHENHLRRMQEQGRSPRKQGRNSNPFSQVA